MTQLDEKEGNCEKMYNNEEEKKREIDRKRDEGQTKINYMGEKKIRKGGRRNVEKISLSRIQWTAILFAGRKCEAWRKFH